MTFVAPSPLAALRSMLVERVRDEDYDMYRYIRDRRHDEPGGLIDHIIISECGPALERAVALV